jgi:hemoglobin
MTIGRFPRSRQFSPKPNLTAFGQIAKVQYLVTEMVCWATGGPQQYTGHSMRDSHVHLDIMEDEWQVFLADLQACLDHFAVLKVEQGEIFALVDSTKSDVVLPANTARP